MTLTSADVVNRAVQLIGGYNNQGPVTGSAPTFDGTPLGKAAGAVYQSVVQTIGRQFGWDFSRNVAALVATGGTAQLGFSTEYLYPTNGIQVRQIIPATLNTDALLNPKPQRWTVGNAITNLTAAAGTITFSLNPSNGDTITLNGVVWTFVNTTPGANETFIGGNVYATLLLLTSASVNNLNTSTDPRLTVATYDIDDTHTKLTISYDTLGTAGNTYSLAASAATRSGATLTGGTTGQAKVIWTNVTSAVASISNQPVESVWDPLFTESVVRLLASTLDLAVPGKPESSAAAFEQAGGFSQLAEKRTDT